MPLTLSILRCPENVPPESRQVSGGEFSIGRGPGNDWVLPDPDRHLSKRHCVLAFRDGAWQLADTRTEWYLPQPRLRASPRRSGARATRRRQAAAWRIRD